MMQLIRFTEQHIRLLALALKQPDERVVARTACVWKPWWAFGLLKRTYFILATDQRAWIVEHSFNLFYGFVVRAVHMVPWANVGEMKVKGIFFKKKLVLSAQTENAVVGGEQIASAGLFRRTMVIDRGFLGLFAPLSGNLDNARAMVEAWKAHRPGVMSSQSLTAMSMARDVQHPSIAPALPQSYPPPPPAIQAGPAAAYAATMRSYESAPPPRISSQPPMQGGYPQPPSAQGPTAYGHPQAPSGYPQAPSAYPHAPQHAFPEGAHARYPQAWPVRSA